MGHTRQGARRDKKLVWYRQLIRYKKPVRHRRFRLIVGLGRDNPEDGEVGTSGTFSSTALIILVRRVNQARPNTPISQHGGHNRITPGQGRVPVFGYVLTAIALVCAGAVPAIPALATGRLPSGRSCSRHRGQIPPAFRGFWSTISGAVKAVAGDACGRGGRPACYLPTRPRSSMASRTVFRTSSRPAPALARTPP